VPLNFLFLIAVCFIDLLEAFSLSTTRDNPGVDFKAPMHLRSKIHDVGDHSKLNAMFRSPFIGGSLLISS